MKGMRKCDKLPCSQVASILIEVSISFWVLIRASNEKTGARAFFSHSKIFISHFSSQRYITELGFVHTRFGCLLSNFQNLMFLLSALKHYICIVEITFWIDPWNKSRNNAWWMTELYLFLKNINFSWELFS